MREMFNYDSLIISIYRILAEEIPDAKYSELLRLASRLGEEVAEKMPKHGDFLLSEDDGRLYINLGWKEVSPQELAQ